MANIRLTPYSGRRYDYPVLETTVLGIWVVLTPVFSWRDDAPHRYQLHGTQPVDYEYDILEFQDIDDYILHILNAREPGRWYEPSLRERRLDSLDEEGSFGGITTGAGDISSGTASRAALPSAVEFTVRTSDTADLREVGRRVEEILNVGLTPHQGDRFHGVPALEANVLGIWITLSAVQGARPGGPHDYELQGRPPPDDPGPFEGRHDISDYVLGVFECKEPGRWHCLAPRVDKM